ncbi:FAD:protein FMN transferase [Nocardioides sp.]|uniref:FAD:protein FMN transferase n=1 Tax=Nocardioides sp. TaxID=35761 RepID=UPI0037830439
MPVATDDWSLWTTSARLVVTEPSRLPEARTVADRLLAEVDLAANRFRGDSELRRLPARLTQGHGRTRISPVLERLLTVALDAAAWTDGAVDPTLGRALVDLGYDRDLAALPAYDGRPVVARQAPGWQRVSVGDGWLTAPPTLELDLGATAKAAAADLVAGAVADRCGTGVLVSLGGDIATAGPAPEGGWQVTVGDGPGEPVSHVTLPAGSAIATSSTLHRTWHRAGRTVHHILDPATGLPAAAVWRTVSVAADRCADANAASTAAVVKGTAGLRWLRERGLTARLVDDTGRVHPVGGWPAEQQAA